MGNQEIRKNPAVLLKNLLTQIKERHFPKGFINYDRNYDLNKKPLEFVGCIFSKNFIYGKKWYDFFGKPKLIETQTKLVIVSNKKSFGSLKFKLEFHSEVLSFTQKQITRIFENNGYKI